MERTQRVTLTNMCMICEGTRVLVLDRQDPDWPGVTFPGGHVEAGESMTDAVVREVLEETGLTISRIRLCGVKDWVEDDGSRYMVLCYRTECFEGVPVSSHEGRVFWAEMQELSRLPLAEGMKTMLSLFTEEEISEYFFYKTGDAWTGVLK